MRALAPALLFALALPAQQHSIHSLDGTWQIRRDTDPAAAEREIQVPSTFETVFGTEFDGKAIYRRAIPAEHIAPGKIGTRMYLRFHAVATACTVRLIAGDGTRIELGQHLGGWTPFRFRIDDRFRQHPTERAWQLEVTVDEKVGHNTQGFLPIIAPHFGGIWQSVDLLRLPPGSLDPDQLEVRTSYRDGTARLDIETGLDHAYWRAELDGKALSAPESGRLQTSAEARPWSPVDPHQHKLRIVRVGEDGRERESLERWIAFTSVRSEGRKILLNDRPLVVRGLLHWGYEPPGLAPNRPVEHWARQFRLYKARGYNLIKACLWVPPPSFFEAAEIVGMLVWQEYPAWHPDFSQKHLADLLREYEEFFRLDRSRSTILCRSLTCETGHAAAEDAVIKRLFERCKEVTGGALVVDDSSWITWHRYHDFYDDHPYGNCGDWLPRLDGFDAHIKKHGAKPLLLGEAITADTWLDFKALDPRIPADAWWRPWAYDIQKQFEADLRQRHGDATADALIPDSKRYAMLARKYQIETFRRRLPHAGYVVSVIRDFRKARMGLLDDLDQPKWTAEDWAWHGEDMILPLELRPRRGLAAAEPIDRFLPKDPQLRTTTKEAWFAAGRWHETRQGDQVLQRIDLQARRGKARNSWRFYRLPDTAAPEDENLRVQARLDLATLDWVARGGRLLLTAGGKHSLKSQRIWFLRGAPYGPATHPLFAQLPRELLLHLQPMDLDGPVFHNTPLLAAMDPILSFWDSHDRKDELMTYAFLAEARLGKGRILACALNVAPDPAWPARAHVRHALLRHLLAGPAPRAELDAALLGKVRQGLVARREALEGIWRLQPDTDDLGLRDNWQRPDYDDSGWMAAQAGKHWEALGLQHDGVAWYRKRFNVPAFHQAGQPLFAVFEGVDDSYTLFVNGKRVASFGDPKTGKTVWLVRTKADISAYLRPGNNVLALRVVDHVGAGGLHRGVFLTNADPGMGGLLNR